MSFENLDQGQQQPTFEQPAQQQAPQDNSVLQVDGRVYKDLEDIKTKITNQDAFIETLKKELDDSRNQTASLLDQQEQLNQDNQTNNKVDKLLERLNQTGTEPSNDGASTVDPNEVVNKVLEQLDIRKNETSAAQNLNSCMQVAEETYGDKVGEVITNTASQLKMSLAEVDELAKKNPQVFKQLFIKAESSNSSRSTYTTAQLRPENQEPVKAKPFMRMNSKEKALYIKDRMESLS